MKTTLLLAVALSAFTNITQAETPIEADWTYNGNGFDRSNPDSIGETTTEDGVTTTRTTMAGLGGWAGMSSNVEVPAGKSLNFRLRSETPIPLFVVRIQDSSMQTLEYRFGYRMPGKWEGKLGAWQFYGIYLDKEAKAYWKGNADGIIEFPIKSVQVFIGNTKDEPAPAEVTFQTKDWTTSVE